MNLSKKVVSSSFWSMFASIADKISILIIYAILARLVGVEELGYVAFSLIIIELITLIIGMGIKESLIKSEEWNLKKVNTAFWLLITFGAIFSLLIYFVFADLVSRFHSSEVANILTAFCLYPVMNSINIFQISYLQREFKYKILAFRSIITTTVSGVVGIYFAFDDSGAMALVYSKYTQILLSTVILWNATRYFPKIEFSYKLASELCSFGFPLVISQVVKFSHQRMVDVLVGIYFGTYYFAILDVGRKGVQTVFQMTLTPLNSVSLSYFSRTSDKHEAFSSFVSIVSCFVDPLVLSIGYFSTEIIYIAFGEKWSESAYILQTLSFGVFHATIGWYLPNYLVAMSQPKLVLYFTLLDLFLVITGCVIASSLDFNAFVIVSVFSMSISVSIKLIVLRIYSDFSLRRFLKAMLGPITGSTILLLSNYSLEFSPLVKLVSSDSLIFEYSLKIIIFGGLGLVVYAVVICLFFKELFFNLKKLVNK